MSLLSDLLKELPTGAVLKERLEALRERYDGLETERDLLRIELSRAHNRIKSLEDELASLKGNVPVPVQPVSLDAKAVQVLRLFVEDETSEYYLLAASGLSHVETKYYLQELQDGGYVMLGAVDYEQGGIYYLEQKGRKWLIENGGA